MDPAMTPPPSPIQDRRTDLGVVFIHSCLDDYGLSPQQFRVYAHLARRAGGGKAFPSVATVARVCKLHPQTARAALHVLVKHRLISRETRPGTTPIYRLTPCTEWDPPVSIASTPRGKSGPISVSEGGTTKGVEGCPYETEVGKGYPCEGHPRTALGERDNGPLANVSQSRASGVRERQLRTQFVALREQIRDLERRADDLDSHDRLALRRKRQQLDAIQRRQASGDF